MTSHPPVIVAGMHRSGTSLAASWLDALGVDLGGDLIGADERNPKGYYEDRAVVDMHGRLLTAATKAGEPGHADWGWTASERIDRGVQARFIGEARSFLRRRQRDDRPWGFKDPRASLLLDFWDELRADARFVLIYRFPWEVADSMQRVGEEVFLDHPEYAYPAWRLYNEHLLDFHRRHGDRSVLVSSNAFPRAPEQFVDLVRGKLGLALGGTLDGLFEERFFRSHDADDPIGALAAEAFPACADLLEELDRAADVSSAAFWRRTPRDPAAAASAPPRVVVRIEGSRRDASLEVETRASIERVARGCRVQAIGHRGRAATPFIEEYVLSLAAGDRLAPGWIEAATHHLDAHPDDAFATGTVRRYGKARDAEPVSLDAPVGAVARAAAVDARGRPTGRRARLDAAAIDHRVAGKRRRSMSNLLRGVASTAIRVVFARRLDEPFSR